MYYWLDYYNKNNTKTAEDIVFLSQCHKEIHLLQAAVILWLTAVLHYGTDVLLLINLKPGVHQRQAIISKKKKV